MIGHSLWRMGTSTARDPVGNAMPTRRNQGLVHRHLPQYMCCSPTHARVRDVNLRGATVWATVCSKEHTSYDRRDGHVKMSAIPTEHERVCLQCALPPPLSLSLSRARESLNL